MAQGVHKITEQFENEVAKYTGVPYCCALDNCSNALFLALKWCQIEGQEITIPAHTYPSVPCEIIHAGGKVKFKHSKAFNKPGLIDDVSEVKTLKGAYRLDPTPVWDSALRFTAWMYIPGTFMCLSFTGPYKHLKLGKGGAILTDNPIAFAWFKRARFSGRKECSYHSDHFDQLGWNFYMMPEIAARGLLLMSQFYDQNGNSKQNPDLELPYPDLSKFPIYQEANR